MCLRYNEGVEGIRENPDRMGQTEAFLDAERYENVRERLVKQVRDARIWK
jgi:alpha-glucuronidase